MTKADLIAAIAKEAKIPKVSAEKALNAFTASVTKALKKGDKLTLSGCGTFSVAKRRLRTRLESGTSSVANTRQNKTTGFQHVAKPATADKILKSLKINKVSEYAIHNKLSH